MSNANVPATAGNGNPIVSILNGQVIANSRDVAAFFNKRHADVLRAIDDIVEAAPIAQRHFAFSEYRDSTGRTHRQFTMNRDGFTLVGFGFSGSEAINWKLKYIDAFNAMEAQLSNQVQVPDLNDPRQLRKLLGDYADKAEALQEQVAVMMPSVRALDRIALSEGSLCITDAAKNLQIPRTKLFAYLRDKKWIYRRPDTTTDIAYQDKINADLAEHKVNVVKNAKTGGDLTITQVRITPKGLARLAKELK